MILIWHFVLLSPNKIYLSFHCLKEICGLIQQYCHHILYYLWPTYKPYWRLPFALDSGILYFLKFYDLIIFLILRLELQKLLFVSASSESISLGYFSPGLSGFSIWLCGSWLLIKFSLNCEEAWSTKLPYDSSFILFMFKTSWTPFSCSYFWHIGGKLKTFFLSPLNEKNKSSIW